MIFARLSNEELITHIDALEAPTDLERELALRLALALDAIADMETEQTVNAHTNTSQEVPE